MNGAPDALIRSTPADVSRHRFVDVFIGGPWFFAQQHGSAHQLSRLAIAALRHVFGNPSALQWMTQIGREALDGCYFFACCPRQRRDAGSHCLAIEMYGACAALRHAATVLRPCETEIFPQHPEQGSCRIHVEVYALLVDNERDHRDTSHE